MPKEKVEVTGLAHGLVSNLSTTDAPLTSAPYMLDVDPLTERGLISGLKEDLAATNAAGKDSVVGVFFRDGDTYYSVYEDDLGNVQIGEDVGPGGAQNPTDTGFDGHEWMTLTGRSVRVARGRTDVPLFAGAPVREGDGGDPIGQTAKLERFSLSGIDGELASPMFYDAAGLMDTDDEIGFGIREGGDRVWIFNHSTGQVIGDSKTSCIDTDGDPISANLGQTRAIASGARHLAVYSESGQSGNGVVTFFGFNAGTGQLVLKGTTIINRPVLNGGSSMVVSDMLFTPNRYWSTGYTPPPGDYYLVFYFHDTRTNGVYKIVAGRSQDPDITTDTESTLGFATFLYRSSVTLSVDTSTWELTIPSAVSLTNISPNIRGTDESQARNGMFFIENTVDGNHQYFNMQISKRPLMELTQVSNFGTVQRMSAGLLVNFYSGPSVPKLSTNNGGTHDWAPISGPCLMSVAMLASSSDTLYPSSGFNESLLYQFDVDDEVLAAGGFLDPMSFSGAKFRRGGGANCPYNNGFTDGTGVDGIFLVKFGGHFYQLNIVPGAPDGEHVEAYPPYGTGDDAMTKIPLTRYSNVFIGCGQDGVIASLSNPFDANVYQPYGVFSQSSICGKAFCHITSSSISPFSGNGYFDGFDGGVAFVLAEIAPELKASGVDARVSYGYHIAAEFDGYQVGPLSTQLTAVTPTEDDQATRIRIFIPQNAHVMENRRITGLLVFKTEFRWSGDALGQVATMPRRIARIDLVNDGGLSQLFPGYGGYFHLFEIADTNTIGEAFADISGYSHENESCTPNYSVSHWDGSFHYMGNCGDVPGVSDSSTYVFRSQPGAPDQVDLYGDFVVLPDIPRAMASFRDKLYVFTEHGAHIVNTRGEFYIERSIPEMRVVWPAAAYSCDYGVIVAATDGLYVDRGDGFVNVAEKFWRNKDYPFLAYEKITQAKTMACHYDIKRDCFVVILSLNNQQIGFLVRKDDLSVWPFTPLSGEIWRMATAPWDQSIVCFFRDSEILPRKLFGGEDYREFTVLSHAFDIGHPYLSKYFYSVFVVTRGAVDMTANLKVVDENGSLISDSTPSHSSGSSITRRTMAADARKHRFVSVQLTDVPGSVFVDSFGVVYRAHQRVR